MLFDQILKQILFGPIPNNGPLQIGVLFEQLGYDLDHQIDPLPIEQPPHSDQPHHPIPLFLLSLLKPRYI